jgi:hypothetical protein
VERLRKWAEKPSLPGVSNVLDDLRPHRSQTNPRSLANLHPKAKGTPNKNTVLIAEAMQYAFKGIGGAPALTEWARAHRSEFYAMYAKMLPNQTKIDLSITVGLSERLERAKQRLGDNVMKDIEAIAVEHAKEPDSSSD